jgi:putative hydrolase of the HAD superfamily
MKEIKAVLFDLDNTLLDRTEGAYRTFRYFLSSVLKVDPDSVYGEALVQDMMNWDGFGNIRKNFITECLQKEYGYDTGDLDFAQWWFHHLCLFEEKYPQTDEVMEYLSKKYRLAILTNGDHFSQSNKVRRSQLDKYVEFTLISADVGKPKPDPLMYRMALEKMGIEPEEAVYVGDTFGKDILGAYNVGIRPIWIWPEDGRHSLEQITRIRKISDLMDIL